VILVSNALLGHASQNVLFFAVLAKNTLTVPKQEEAAFPRASVRHAQSAARQALFPMLRGYALAILFQMAYVLVLH